MVRFTIPFFPPSTNNAYSVWHGRLHLTKVGKKFKKEVTSYLVQNYMQDLRVFQKNVPYLMYLRLFFEKLENKGWPDKCDTRYKVFDVTNRVKLAEDAFKDAFGIDDSQTMAFVTHKCEGEEHMELFTWDMEKEVTPLGHFIEL